MKDPPDIIGKGNRNEKKTKQYISVAICVKVFIAPCSGSLCHVKEPPPKLRGFKQEYFVPTQNCVWIRSLGLLLFRFFYAAAIR